MSAAVTDAPESNYDLVTSLETEAGDYLKSLRDGGASVDDIAWAEKFYEMALKARDRYFRESLS